MILIEAIATYPSGFMLRFVDYSSALSGIELHLECDLTTSECAIMCACACVCVHVLCVCVCVHVSLCVIMYYVHCTCVCMCVCVCQYVGVWEMRVIVVYSA